MLPVGDFSTFYAHACEQIADGPLFESVRKALETVEKHWQRLLRRWTSTHGNGRLEAMNGWFPATRARGYRNEATFIIVIYLIAAPLGSLFNSI